MAPAGGRWVYCESLRVRACRDGSPARGSGRVQAPPRHFPRLRSAVRRARPTALPPPPAERVSACLPACLQRCECARYTEAHSHVRFVCAHGPDHSAAGRQPWSRVCAEEYASERPYVGAAEVRFERSAADTQRRAHAEDRRAQHARVLPAQCLAHGCAEVTEPHGGLTAAVRRAFGAQRRMPSGQQPHRTRPSSTAAPGTDGEGRQRG